MSANSKKRYQPRHLTNPIILGKKIERLSADLEQHKKTMDAVLESYNHHMDYLSKFARHDMGNAIQNISALIKTMEGSVDATIIEALKSSVNNLNSSLINLGQLIHYSPDRTFKIHELITALEILVRESSLAQQIRVTAKVDRNNTEIISQPYQQLLQLLHNLIINAQKSFSKTADNKIIEIEANIIKDECVIYIKDNGCGIPPENLPLIFNYGFTTTDGHGIGLFHAKHICTEIGGDISVTQNINGFSTIFTIKFPKDGSKKDFDN